MKPSQLRSSLPRLLEAKRSIFLWGEPGIGKSDIVREVAASKKLSMVDMRLSIYDPTDLKGFPIVKDGAMYFVPPALLPKKGKGVLLLDEFPQAPPAVQAVAYQLVLDRRLGEYTLPDGWSIVAAGNRASDGGVHYSLPAALANRFIHLNLTVNHPDWDEWAAKNGISDLTRAYLRFRPDQLLDMGARKTGMAYPSPRSWAMADTVIQQKHGAAEELEMLTGTVGEGVATEYMAFVKVASELPTSAQIILAPDKAPLPKSPGAKHAAVLMMERAAMPSNLGACFAYIERLEVEYQVVFAQGLARNMKLNQQKPFVDWAVKNAKVMGLE